MSCFESPCFLENAHVCVSMCVCVCACIENNKITILKEKIQEKCKGKMEPCRRCGGSSFPDQMGRHLHKFYNLCFEGNQLSRSSASNKGR